ncbi:hypothetical protein [Fructilactobacillus frigidiflavus]|uniref:hypothetical protein n=1 Tax=Fructilactobacillus frigidiflavus TaxID=3242688 RepID=UPI0037580CF6
MKTSEMSGNAISTLDTFIFSQKKGNTILSDDELETLYKIIIPNFSFPGDDKFCVDLLTSEEIKVVDKLKDEFVEKYGKTFNISNLEWDKL